MDYASFMLKPCFCGGKRTIEYKTHTAGMGEGYANWEMRCDKCHGLWTLSADNFYGSTPYTQSEAIKIWNDMVTESEDEDVECKVLEFDKVSRDGTIISKDAFKDQDGKLVPLKWGSGPDAKVLGTVELNLELDGVYMSISKEDYENIRKMMEEER